MPEVVAFGGAERVVIALARWLHERSIPYRVLLYYDHIGLGRFADHPIELVVLEPARSLFGKLSALRCYFNALPVEAPAPLMSGIQAATHASLVGQRGFHTLMYDTPSLLSYGVGRLSPRQRLRQFAVDRTLTRGLNSGGKTIVTSEYVKAEAVRLWHPPVVIARMGGVPGRTFRPRTGADGKLRMLSVCRVEANKRIDWIISGLAELERRPTPLSEKIDWHLNIVGGGSEIEALTAMATQLGLGGRITFHGFVPDEALEDHYDRADLFLMPALQGYGLPAAEAFDRGLPVLLHRDSGISDLLLDTPWAVVMYGGAAEMPAALERGIDNVLNHKHIDVALPRIPTQDEWAEQVARLCGWYDGDSGR